MAAAVPADFARFMVTLHGPRGAAWVAALPALLSDLEARWQVRVLPPFPNLSYNYAAPAERADGTPVVIKVGVPNQELASEAEALRCFAGQGSVRLLEAAPADGAMLLERLLPGTMLSTVEDDDAATHIAAGVMRALWRPPPPAHSFPTVAQWAAGLQRLRARFAGGTGPLPAPLVAQAEGCLADLLSADEPPRLMHGDLHHFNILSAGPERWLAIDPKGLVGDPGYEVGPLLYNQVDTLAAVPDPARKLGRRVAILAERLGFEPPRIAMWGVAASVLSAWWSVEDQGEVDGGVLRVAELLSELVRSG